MLSIIYEEFLFKGNVLLQLQEEINYLSTTENSEDQQLQEFIEHNYNSLLKDFLRFQTFVEQER